VNEWPSTVGLLVRQIRYQILMFRRVPIALFFTLMLPLIMLVLFNALFGDGEVTVDGNTWPTRQFYTGGLAAFTAVSATYTNLANMVPIRREEGVLKRWRGTPLPKWIYFAGMIGSAVVIAVFGVFITLSLGVVAYDLEVEAAKMPAAALTFVVGVAAFAALGMAVAGLVSSASSASAVANATILPLAFISNIFIPIEEPPAWLKTIGDIFPLKPFASSFQDAFNPLVEAPAFDWGALARIAAWGIAGLVVALTSFRWEAAPGGPTRRRSARSAPVDVLE
jgi:ABC-2 type transport system permease protein